MSSIPKVIGKTTLYGLAAIGAAGVVGIFMMRPKEWWKQSVALVEAKKNFQNK